MLVHIPLTCIISDTKSTVILKFVPVYVLYNFTLSAFKISIYSWFWTIWLYFFSCNFHYISCVWSLLRFWAVGLYFSSDLETFQPLLSKNIFSPFPFKDSSSSCTSPLKILLQFTKIIVLLSVIFLCFYLAGFYCYVVVFTSLFFCYVLLTINFIQCVFKPQF